MHLLRTQGTGEGNHNKETQKITR